MRTLVLVVAMLLSVTVAPARAQFCPGAAPYVFTDVPANDAFCGFITWMAQTGVTTGCVIVNATNRLFCPNDFVTRKQMSAFMSRLGRDTVFAEGGNAFGTLPNSTAVLGTADGSALDIQVNGARVMRYEPNAISPNVIGGSPANNVAAGMRGATIAGGGAPPSAGIDPDFNIAPNWVTDAYGTVGGGLANRAGNDGGLTTDAAFATVAGGAYNTASGYGSTIAGGSNNTASGAYNTIAGGLDNTASGFAYSTVGGGDGNTASGFASTVAGGSLNTASGNESTVAGGYNNAAGGEGSIAGGTNAKANFRGCIVFADNSSVVGETSCFANNEVVIRGLGGFYFWTAGNNDFNYSGARLAPGTGAWAAYSDVAGKVALEPVDTRDILERLLAMRVARWQWKAEPGNVKHIGPTAQDFRIAFGLGDSETQITTVDADGVAMAAIQGLNAKLESEVAAKNAELAALQRQVAELRLAVEVLMARAVAEGALAQRR